MSKQILRWTVVLSKFRYLQIITGWVQADTQNICINWDCPRIEKYVDIFNTSYCTFIIFQTRLISIVSKPISIVVVVVVIVIFVFVQKVRSNLGDVKNIFLLGSLGSILGLILGLIWGSLSSSLLGSVSASMLG